MERKYFAAAGAALLVFLPTVGEAAAGGGEFNPSDNTLIPNSGVILHQMEPERHITPQTRKPQISNKVPEKVEGSHDMTAHVSHVQFICDDLDLNKELRGEDFLNVNKDMAFADMQELALKATNRLREKGYITAVVYVPAQEISNNTLTLKGLIGRYGDIKIDNTSSLMDEKLLSYLYAIRPGNLIEARKLDKALLVLNDIPGLKVSASLEPGKRAGTATVIIKAEDLDRQDGYLIYDNYGSKYTGRNRIGFDWQYNNLSHVGDQIDLSALFSTDHLQNYEARYMLPVGHEGATTHIAMNHMEYKLGKQFKKLHADGQANTFELGITVPMQRTFSHSSFYSLNYRHRDFHDDMFDGLISNKKQSDSLEADIYGYWRGPRDAFSYSIGQVYGHICPENEYTQAIDYLDTLGFYNKTIGNFYYIHDMGENWQLHTSFSGQLAWDNLDSSEDFYVGGADGVRAFPSGEDGGDSGILGTIELRRKTGIEGLTFAAFVDAARIWYNHNDKGIVTGDNARNLAGAGLGLIYQKSRDWYAKLDWATPIGDHYSDSYGEDIHNMVWFRMVKQF